MTTDEEKSKISKLLQGIEVPEVRLPERCSDLVREFHKRFDKEVEEEDQQNEPELEVYENPYRPDQRLLEENERKLRELLTESKRIQKEPPPPVAQTAADPKRPWRTHTNKEKLHRIDSELKQHFERSAQLMAPLDEVVMKELVKECHAESRGTPAVGMERLRETVEAAKKNLPNFQYRKISNTTATVILATAHDIAPRYNESEVAKKNLESDT